MDFKTVREFHWITKTVILLTVFVLVVIPAIAIVASILGLSINGLGMILFSSLSILVQLFPIILIVIVLCIIGAHVKAWIEKYMDAMLSKMDLLAESRSTVENTNAGLAVMSSRMEEIEKKVNNISDLLEKVSE
ncbi:hypothetical protein L1994_10710 [Methanomicrobium antiquum]|uniref:Uncharacterized protein n=1 Tax=Methanomicrobium antiquum TaxID=487686 RepID=A0AAF0JMM8_9EURY|nr:hypothetical protein [Methanomicrobium antiquum]WFN36596.1 hypothetical protein L1994_10710 [Methanomicrobium antiquum]